MEKLEHKLEQIFNNDYPGTDRFIAEVIEPIFGNEIDYINEDLAEIEKYADKAKNAGIKHIKYVGDITEKNYNADNIALLDVTLDDSKNIERSRVNIQQLIRSIMDYRQHLMIVFHYEDVTDKQWRFSYAYKGDSLKDTTSAKRYTYVFGKGYRGRTAAKRFQALADSPRNDEDFEKAFSVEILSDEFFKEYKRQYVKFIRYISGKVYEKKNDKWQDVVYDKPKPFYETSFNGCDKTVRDYVKKLFGRIVFMYFLQKKGWLANDKNYMMHLYENATEQIKEDFLDSILEPLFFGVLNTEYEKRNEAVRSLPGWDNIPYLNGGLFQQDELDKKECCFPGDYFKDLFSFFDRYNFTIDENDPDDAEVGIDPEMLGHIFENLLEDNKDKGAYYTPKEIVDYMCRESVISYLMDDRHTEQGNRQIRHFVESLNSDSLTDKQKEYLKDKLKRIKVCDPAIGSGAFPMGMLNLLSKLYIALNLVSNRKNMKRYIMEKSIYGVDIEKGAVDIARLRFWLAMVVEDDTTDIKKVAPLPNLGFKIMQGNSLIEQYGGIDLSTLLGKSNGEFQFDYIDAEFQKTLEEKLSKFYNAKVAERDSIASQIDSLIANKLSSLNTNLDPNNIKPSETDKFFMWHTWFSDVFKDGGFDIVIGNPPYGAKLSDADKSLLKSIYYTTETIKGVQKGSMDTYTMFIELSYKLLKKGGAFAMIVPISLTSSDSLSGVHRILKLRCDDVRISSYAVRPKPVFKNAVVNTSILLYRKTGEMCKTLKATKMYRKGRNFNLKYLIDNLEYIDVKDFMLFGRIPKISLEKERSILCKLKKHPQIGCYVRTEGKLIYYRSTGGRYFKVVTDYSTSSTKEKYIYFDEKLASAIGCILSSNLSFWFYQIYSNNLDWKNLEICSFHIPNLSDDQIQYLNTLYKNYQEDIELNANIRLSSGNSKYKVESFKEYKIGRSKTIIDKIDDFIGPIYGLSQQEIDFIKNYEIEFRLSDDEDK